MFKMKDFIRDNKPLNQKQMGDILGCGQSNISDISKNKRDITTEQLSKLSNIYGKDYVYSYYYNVDSKPEQILNKVSELPETNTWNSYVTPILNEVVRLSEEVGRLKAELSAVQNKKVVPMEDSAEVADAK